MKRSIYLVAILAMAISACTKEQEEPISNTAEGAPVFSATMNSGSTRTTIDESTRTVSWSSSDAISVFDNEYDNFKYTADGSGTTVNFLPGGSYALVVPDTWHALYPYNEDAAFDGSAITTTLPSEYSVSASGTFEDGMNIAVASSTTLSLPFKSVLCWLRVAIKGVSDVTSITMTGNSGENLAGSLSINTESLDVTVPDEGASKTMTLNISDFKESTSLASGERVNYYIPLVPGTYATGFTFYITTASGKSYQYVLSKSISFNRSKAYGMTIDLSGTQYQKVTNLKKELGNLEGTENLLLVYPAGSTYYVFNFQKAMENAVTAAESVSTTGGISAIVKQATALYQTVLKGNYSTAKSLDGGQTLLLDEEENAGAIIHADGSYRGAKTTLSATVDGKVFSLRMQDMKCSLGDNGNALISAVFNGEDLMDMAATLRGHEISVTFDDCLEFLGEECSLTSDQLENLRKAFDKCCEIVAEYYNKDFPVNHSTTIASFYRQYWDNINSVVKKLGGSSDCWGSAYPFGFYKADDGFTFNVPVPNSAWFDKLEESTSDTLDDFVSYWTAYGDSNDYNFPFETLAGKVKEYVSESGFEAIKAIDFTKIGAKYKEYTTRMNDTLEEVYVYKKVEEE